MAPRRGRSRWSVQPSSLSLSCRSTPEMADPSSIWERRLLGDPVPEPPTTLLSPPCTSPEPAPPASDLPTRLTARAKPPLTQWAPPTGSSAPAPYPHLLARTTAPPAVRPLHLSHCPSRKPGVHKRPAHQQLPPPAQAGPLRSTAAATSRHAARPCSVMAARPLYQEAAGSPGSSPGMVTRWRLLHLGFIPKQC